MKRRFVFLMVPFFFACEGQDEIEFLEVGKRYPLVDFPDSAYVASLDSILAAEPVKKKDSVKTNIVLNSFTPPKLSLPQEASQKSDQKSKKSEGKKVKTGEKPFVERFGEAVSRWQSDPSNKALYVSVEVREGEDALSVLQRLYGNEVRKLPRFYTLSVLQSLNPGISVEHPAEGGVIKLPKI